VCVLATGYPDGLLPYYMNPASLMRDHAAGVLTFHVDLQKQFAIKGIGNSDGATRATRIGVFSEKQIDRMQKLREVARAKGRKGGRGGDRGDEDGSGNDEEGGLPSFGAEAVRRRGGGRGGNKRRGGGGGGWYGGWRGRGRGRGGRRG
jgi:hypothetical protein